MGKLTWVLAIGFICTSLALTIIAAEKAAGVSVLDRLGTQAPATEEQSTPVQVPSGDSLLPPAQGDDAPLTPKAD